MYGSSNRNKRQSGSTSLCAIITYENTLLIDSHFIVGDRMCSHPFISGLKPWPFETVHQSPKDNDGLVVDKTRERFDLTLHRDGNLKRIE